MERGISFTDGYSKEICYASGIDATKEIPFNSILIQPPCYNSSHVEAFVTRHCALKDTKVGCAEVTMLNLAINASTYEEGKIMQGRKMNTPHGSFIMSLVSPTVIPAQKSLTEDLGGSLRLPQIGILQILLESSKSMVYDLS